MKILLLNWMDLSNPLSGGAEVQLIETFSRIVADGAELTLLCSRFKDAKKEDDYKGIRIVRRGTHKTFNFVAPFYINSLDKEHNYDIIVEGLNKVPIFTPLFNKKPLLILVPHLFGTSVFKETNPVFASYVYMMERFIPYVYKNYNFGVVSKSTQVDLVKRGLNASKIRIIYNGLNHQLYSYDKNVQKYDQPTILYVGRIKRYKSTDVVIKAMPRVMQSIANARLVIVGSGDDIPRLKNLAQRLKLSDNIKFTGFVSEEEKVEWLRKSHVVVNPSHKEGWGLTILEANACGTTTIASDVDGLKDAVQNGDTGMLFPYGNTELLAEYIIELINNDKKRNQLEINALKWSNNFIWDKSAEETFDFMNDLLSSNNPG